MPLALLASQTLNLLPGWTLGLLLDQVLDLLPDRAPSLLSNQILSLTRNLLALSKKQAKLFGQIVFCNNVILKLKSCYLPLL